MMKRMLLAMAAITVAVAIGVAGCGSDTTQVRVRNNLSDKVNVSLQPNSGNTINVNDVANGTVSSYVDVTPGMLRIHVSVSSGDAPADLDYTFVRGKSYTVWVNLGTPPTITVVQD